MNYGKNIIATVLICGVVSTVAFAAAKKAVWTLNGEVLQTQIAKNGTWIFVPKNFEIGTLINEQNRKLKLTEENFMKANEVGISYEKACKILGGKGQLTYKEVDINDDNEKETETTYEWEDCTARIRLCFVNGRIDKTAYNHMYFKCD